MTASHSTAFSPVPLSKTSQSPPTATCESVADEAVRLDGNPRLQTTILPIDPNDVGTIVHAIPSHPFLDGWTLIPSIPPSASYDALCRAVKHLLTTSIPLAFPTETVYGLAAPATCTSAVSAVFSTKSRPADNPLIVHVHSLPHLLSILHPNPLPPIYLPLLRRFWPGPLSIILPLPPNSSLSPLTTAGLSTFAARMPSNLLSLLLIKLVDLPIAAPSANTSTFPSPTTAEHVFHDLHSKIRYILSDTTSPSCSVGVESTVVDGLSHPPAILRPGGISLEQIREIPGFEGTIKGYKDKPLSSGEIARAPGMKYRHYAPKARTILFRAGRAAPNADTMIKWLPGRNNSSSNGESIIRSSRKVGVIRTRNWPSTANESTYTLCGSVEVHDVFIGPSAADVAHGLFAALRALDELDVDVIFVEGIDSEDEDEAAAVMNRLRKASELEV